MLPSSLLAKEAEKMQQQEQIKQIENILKTTNYSDVEKIQSTMYNLIGKLFEVEPNSIKTHMDKIGFDINEDSNILDYKITQDFRKNMMIVEVQYSLNKALESKPAAATLIIRNHYKLRGNNILNGNQMTGYQMELAIPSVQGRLLPGSDHHFTIGTSVYPQVANESDLKNGKAHIRYHLDHVNINHNRNHFDLNNPSEIHDTFMELMSEEGKEAFSEKTTNLIKE